VRVKVDVVRAMVRMRILVKIKERVKVIVKVRGR
jgi:hypothetical protein